MKAQMDEFSYFSIPVRMIDNSDNMLLLQQIEDNINEIKNYIHYVEKRSYLSPVDRACLKY